MKTWLFCKKFLYFSIFCISSTTCTHKKIYTSPFLFMIFSFFNKTESMFQNPNIAKILCSSINIHWKNDRKRAMLDVQFSTKCAKLSHDKIYFLMRLESFFKHFHTML